MKTSLPRYLLIAAGLAFGGLTASAAEATNPATVLTITGTATALLPGATMPQPIQQGDKLPEGATITTGPGSIVNIQPFSGAVSTINENSTVSLDKLSLQTSSSGKPTKQTALLKLKTGSVVSMLDPGNKDINDYGVSTAKGVAAARGTDFTTSATDTGGSGITISANADTVQFTLADGSTYSISQGSVVVTPPGGTPQPPVTLASLSNSNSPTALAAKAAIQAGVTAMTSVLSNNTGGLSSAATTGLAASVISVANVAVPAAAAANTAAIITAVSNNSSGTPGAVAASAIATVMTAAVQAAPTQVAAIASSVATSVANSGQATAAASVGAAVSAAVTAAPASAAAITSSVVTAVSSSANTAVASAVVTSTVQAAVQAAPASAAAIKPSGNGKKASLATALPSSERPASFAFQIAMRDESTRDICPAPMPRVRSFAA